LIHVSLFNVDGLPLWLPDETVFSICSRYHRLSAHWSHKRTGKILFDHARGAVAHDLPCRLDALARNTRHAWGDAASMALEHTVLPVYLPLKPAVHCRAALAAMCGQDGSGLRFCLGVRAHGMGTAHPLKACAECLEEDLRTLGTAYWHRAHQLPGVWRCPRHGTPILVSRMKAKGERRFAWLLPDEAELSPSHADADTGQGLNDPAAQLARCAISWTARAMDLHLDRERLAFVYVDRLRQRHLMSARGRLKTKPACEDAGRFLGPLARVPELVHLVGQPQLISQRIARLCVPHRMPTQPLAHLWFIAWLFRDLDEFLAAYEAQPSDLPHPPSPASQPSVVSRADLRGHQLLELVRNDHVCVTSAARRLGVDPTTGMTWAAAAGVVTSRRPKHLNAECRRRLCADLRRGMAKDRAASKYGLSVTTVTRTLFTEPGVHEAWAAARAERARRLARRRWLTSASRHPDFSAKALRALEPAAYAWLYRNDRAWLQVRTNPRAITPL
jgi:transposase